MTERLSVYQRVSAVSREIAQVKPTGKNQYGKPAYSIVDVENAIRELMIKHGLLSRWSSVFANFIPDGKIWQVRYRVRICNVEDPQDYFDDYSEDTGANASAARSFAIKGYYKSLFHIAEEDESGWQPLDRQSLDKNSVEPKSPPKVQPPSKKEEIRVKIRGLIADCLKPDKGADSITAEAIMEEAKKNVGCEGRSGDDLSIDELNAIFDSIKEHYNKLIRTKATKTAPDK